MIERGRWQRVVLLAVALAFGVVACRRSQSSSAPESERSAVVVRPQSEGLLFTWIDDKGDFHVEASVPTCP